MIRNPAYPNVKQVLAVMVVSQEIHNHKVICYLNKQSVCISYEDISRQNIIWEVAVLGEDSGTASLLKRVPTHSSIDNVVQIFSNPICLLVTVIHVNRECTNPWNILALEQQNKLHSISRLQGPKPFSDFEDNN